MTDRDNVAFKQLLAQRDALRVELKEATEAIDDPAVNNLRTLPESIRVLCAQRDALLEALELALSSHGVMLASDPPQEAWKVYGVEAKARAAIKAAKEGK